MTIQLFFEAPDHTEGMSCGNVSRNCVGRFRGNVGATTAVRYC